MSSIGAISGFSAMLYQSSSRAMLDAAAADEGDEDGEFMVESENNVELDSFSEDNEEEGESEPASSLGSQIDAWG
jgi:hypothetical protein